MAAKNHIDLVVKTMAVLEALAISEYGKPLKEIAREVGLVKSSAFRILFTLKEAGYVEQPEMNGVYRLSLKTAGLARRNSNRLGLATVARPHLTLLRENRWPSQNVSPTPSCSLMSSRHRILFG
jgi:DNA-binding IclR family transcriptional regulator